MARLVALDINCRNRCGRRSTVVLQDCRGAVQGHYCERCGTTACARLQAAEDRASGRYGPTPREPEGG